MAQIEGLKEQQDALKRIKNNLKDIQDTNSLIRSILTLSEDASLHVSYDVTITFEKDSDIKRFKTPIVFQDNRVILEAVQKYRDSIIAKVKEDSTLYRISLNPQEHALLEPLVESN